MSLPKHHGHAARSVVLASIQQGATAPQRQVVAVRKTVVPSGLPPLAVLPRRHIGRTRQRLIAVSLTVRAQPAPGWCQAGTAVAPQGRPR